MDSTAVSRYATPVAARGTLLVVGGLNRKPPIWLSVLLHHGLPTAAEVTADELC